MLAAVSDGVWPGQDEDLRDEQPEGEHHRHDTTGGQGQEKIISKFVFLQ